ncbi:MAG: TolB family protein, partial [Anaerolineales bacterium]
YVMKLANQSVTRLTEPTAEFDIARQPSWSPAGNQVLFAKKRSGAYQIWAMTDTGLAEQQIVHSGQQYWDYLPIWSPDGTTISFTERRVGPKISVLPWAMTIPYENRDITGGNQIQIKPLPVENIHYSPDGKWFVFEGKGPNNNLDIFYSTITGTERTRLTTDPGYDFDPAWRP